MSENQSVNTSRRAFFLKGSAAVGATLASATAGAASLLDTSLPLKQQLSQLHEQLASMNDKEALRQLHQVFSAAVENCSYATVVELFADDAIIEAHGQRYQGKQQGIRKLFMEQYATQQTAVMHTAYRQDQSQQKDQLHISADRQSASAAFHTLVELSKPQLDQSVPGQMARLQGMSTSSSWESGKFVVDYRQFEGKWYIQSLKYQPA